MYLPLSLAHTRCSINWGGGVETKSEWNARDGPSKHGPHLWVWSASRSHPATSQGQVHLTRASSFSVRALLTRSFSRFWF